MTKEQRVQEVIKARARKHNHWASRVAAVLWPEYMVMGCGPYALVKHCISRIVYLCPSMAAAETLKRRDDRRDCDPDCAADTDARMHEIVALAHEQEETLGVARQHRPLWAKWGWTRLAAWYRWPNAREIEGLGSFAAVSHSGAGSGEYVHLYNRRASTEQHRGAEKVIELCESDPRVEEGWAEQRAWSRRQVYKHTGFREILSMPLPRDWVPKVEHLFFGAPRRAA